MDFQASVQKIILHGLSGLVLYVCFTAIINDIVLFLSQSPQQNYLNNFSGYFIQFKKYNVKTHMNIQENMKASTKRIKYIKTCENPIQKEYSVYSYFPPFNLCNDLCNDHFPLKCLQMINLQRTILLLLIKYHHYHQYHQQNSNSGL